MKRKGGKLNTPEDIEEDKRRQLAERLRLQSQSQRTGEPTRPFTVSEGPRPVPGLFQMGSRPVPSLPPPTGPLTRSGGKKSRKSKRKTNRRRRV